MTPCILEVQDLSLTRAADGAPLVRVDRLRFRPGQTHVLLGKTGAGKSLLAKAIAGLPLPGVGVEGQILRPGHPQASLGGEAPLWRNTVFLLPQEPATSLDPTASVGSQLEEVLRWRKSKLARERKGLEAAAAVGLTPEDLRKLPHACSGGMLQRVLIAMALVVDAGLIVCDEPTKGLDPDRRAEVVELLGHLKERRYGLFVITHDLALAKAAGDDLSVMEAGRVVEQGPIDRLRLRPHSLALSSLLRSEPDRWEKKAGEPPADGGPEMVSLRGIRHAVNGRKSPLLRDIDLAVKPGEVVGLCGPSGVGKTTLGNIALGLVEPTSGQVTWRGRALSSLSRRERRAWRPDFLKLFQDPTATFAPWLTAGTVLRKLSPNRNPSYQGEAGLLRLLDRLQLAADVLHRRPGELSGGEMQRLAIARIVLARPLFLVCDEPSSRLDMVVQREAVDLIVDFAKEMSAGVLFITHDDRILAKVAQRNLELRSDGRLYAFEPARVPALARG